MDGGRARAHEGGNIAVRTQVEPHAVEGISQHIITDNQKQVLRPEELRETPG